MTSKYDRILSLYEMLNEGKVINKSNAAFEFGVTERTIQRDIDDIRAFFYSNTINVCSEKSVVFDRKQKGYCLKDENDKMLTNSEILAVCKILLESRSMRNDEMMPILEKLLDCCVPESNKKPVKKLIANEQYHYVQPRHNKCILDGLWEIGQAVEQNRIMEIDYQRTNGSFVKRILEPVGILFSEYYFYLVGFLRGVNRQQCFENPNDLFPTIYRIDRIQNFLITNERFTPIYKNRFEEGEFRKRIQFMFGGRLNRIKFKYVGHSIESVLDRLPTAKIIQEDKNG